MNVYRKIDRSKIQFDFACTDYGFDNYLEEITQLGGNVFFVKKETLQNIRQLVSSLLATGKYSYLQYHGISKWGCSLSVAHKYNVKTIVESHSAGLSDTPHNLKRIGYSDGESKEYFRFYKRMEIKLQE